jgi:5-methylcytosine-specific restriction endonuclease McrA
MRRQRRLKQRAVDYKGSRGQRCGYDRYVGSLEFHHRNPSRKDFTFSQAKMKKFELVKDELDKCDLLCVNCHREAHARMAEH